MFWRSLTKIAGSWSISQRYGSADPDPCQNFMDPQHLFIVCCFWSVSLHGKFSRFCAELIFFQAGERNSSARQKATANQTPRLYHPRRHANTFQRYCHWPLSHCQSRLKSVFGGYKYQEGIHVFLFVYCVQLHKVVYSSSMWTIISGILPIILFDILLTYLNSSHPYTIFCQRFSHKYPPTCIVYLLAGSV